MKQFNSLRRVEQIEESLLRLGYRWIESSRILFEQGSDWMLFVNEDELKALLVNTVNGQFLVKDIITDDLTATHESCELDEEEWYADILDAIYN